MRGRIGLIGFVGTAIVLLAVAALLITATTGCISYSTVANDNHDKERGVDARVASVDLKLPEVPAPKMDEGAEAFAARLAVYKEVALAAVEAIKSVKLPDSIAGITIHDIQYWKDQRGQGGAETKSKGEASADAAVGVGGSNVTKEGGRQQTEQNPETETTENAMGGGGAVDTGN